MNRLLTYLDKRILGEALHRIINQKILEPEELPADIVRLELYSIEHIWQEVKQRFHQIEDAKKQILYRTNALITLVILAVALIINNLVSDEVKVRFSEAESSYAYDIGLFISPIIIFVVAIQNFHPAIGIIITGYPDNSHIRSLIDNSEADMTTKLQKKQVLIQAIQTYRTANAENAKILLRACKFLAGQIFLSGVLIFGVIHFTRT